MIIDTATSDDAFNLTYVFNLTMYPKPKWRNGFKVSTFLVTSYDHDKATSAAWRISSHPPPFFGETRWNNGAVNSIKGHQKEGLRKASGRPQVLSKFMAWLIQIGTNPL